MSPTLLFFLWQLLGPNDPIVVSKQTTFITAPLAPNGLPNYPQFILETSRAGVTPENNAAVLMWQAIGPGTGQNAISSEHWQALCRELHFVPTANSSDYLPPLYCMENRRAIAAWLHQQGRLRTAQGSPSEATAQEILKSQSWPKSEEASQLYDLVETHIDGAVESPWNSEKLPPLASWLTKHQAQLDLLVEASRRSRFHSPDPAVLLGTEDDLLPSLESIQATREIARILSARAMWRLGEGHPDQAWENLLAIFRWSRLVRQGSTIVQQLVGLAIEGIACDATITLLSDSNLPSELARQIQHDLDTLPPAATMADTFEGTERLFPLTTAIAIHEGGAGSVIKELALGDNPQPPLEFLDYVAFDWNPLLIQINEWNDKTAAAVRLPTFPARMQEFARLEREQQELTTPLQNPTNWIVGALRRDKRSQMFAAAVIQFWFSSPALYLSAEDRNNTRLDLTRLAAAIAVYRTEHGKYPTGLAELTPEIIPQLPTDLFHAKSFVYQPEADGYLLYCTGENGIDDAGSNTLYGGGILAGRQLEWTEDEATEKLREQIPAGADDISIRLPRPPFKLPEPPASQ